MHVFVHLRGVDRRSGHAALSGFCYNNGSIEQHSQSRTDVSTGGKERLLMDECFPAVVADWLTHSLTHLWSMDAHTMTFSLPLKRKADWKCLDAVCVCVWVRIKGCNSNLYDNKCLIIDWLLIRVYSVSKLVPAVTPETSKAEVLITESPTSCIGQWWDTSFCIFVIL